MSSYKNEIITYQVTLKGFWEDSQKRLWKCGRNVYHVDMKNNATLVQQTSPPTFTTISERVETNAEDDMKKAIMAKEIEDELDALFENNNVDSNIGEQVSKRGYYDLPEKEPSNKKPKTI